MNHLSFLAAFILLLSHLQTGMAKEPINIMTMSFRQAKSLMVGQAALEVDSHVTTRLLDFNEDGTIDLITGNGKGELKVYLGKRSEDGIDFQRATTIRAGSKLRWVIPYRRGTSPYCGQRRTDLVVGHTSNKISIHPCKFKNEAVFRRCV